MSREETIKQKQMRNKKALLEQLRRTPTIETSCQKVGISRATVYRWMKRSKKFEQQVNDALVDGRRLMSDVAENQLFSLIGEKRMEAIRLYLSTHNPRYNNKLELSGRIEAEEEHLSEKEKELIRSALKLSSLNSYVKFRNKKDQSK